MKLQDLRRDAALLQYSSTGNVTFHCFVHNQQSSGLMAALPSVASSHSAENQNTSWKSAEFWKTPQLPRSEGKEKVAVFECDLSAIPFEAIGALKSQRFSQIAFIVNGTWHLLGLRSFAGTCGVAIWKLRRRVSALRFRCINILRRLALKKYAIDLREAGASEFTPESGKAFTTSVPFLLEHADSSSAERSTVMIFEESSLLSPHHAHDAIRNEGSGRYSLWNENLYFSSTDGSDPRSNRRRYRYLELNNKTRWLANLFGVPLATVEEESSCKPPRLGFRALSVTVGGQCEAEVARRMRGAETRTYPGGTVPSGEVAIFITNLGPGGAERQMTYLAQGLTGRGEKVRVLTYYQSAPETLHYKPVLEESNIPVDFMTSITKGFVLSSFSSPRGAEDARLIAGLPDDFAEEVLSLYTHLVHTRPAVLHCWLDQSNLVGAVAGWLAGVPRIVLSSRSVNPTHFPHIIRDWYQKWYQIVVQCPRVSWVANSKVGAKSYAEWCLYPTERIPVVSNGLDLAAIKMPTSEACRTFRVEVGIPQDAPVVTAVFRMSHEKRPLRFVRLIWELRKIFPNVHAIIAGIGPMEDMVKREIENLKLEDCLHLLGKRSDVPLVMRASDVVVLCSSIEGSPNVLIEAGWLGRPVVTTAVGDVDVIVKQGKTGFICDRDAFEPLLDRTSELLRDALMRERFGNEAREHIGQRFSIDSMVDGMASALQISTHARKDSLCA